MQRVDGDPSPTRTAMHCIKVDQSAFRYIHPSKGERTRSQSPSLNTELGLNSLNFLNRKTTELKALHNKRIIVAPLGFRKQFTVPT